MIWVAGSIMVLASMLGIVMVLFTLPGIWFMAGVSMLIAWWCPQLLGWKAVVVMLVFGAIAELIEFIASAAGVKKLGGSRAGAIGSLIGTIIGAIAGTGLIPIPVVGTIVGGIVGAAGGAFVCERTIAKRTWTESAKSSGGAAMGRAVSVVVKLALAIAAAGFITAALFI
ncbi:MAG: DUF456 domain-containing protein [Phycisphaerales bacterium]|nr:DUF456 domain-containing protein [Phycisphaerales bacterium]